LQNIYLQSTRVKRQKQRIQFFIDAENELCRYLQQGYGYYVREPQMTLKVAFHMHQKCNNWDNEMTICNKMCNVMWCQHFDVKEAFLACDTTYATDDESVTRNVSEKRIC
jgi:hypothetical protein